MRTLHAHRSPLLSRDAAARAHLAVLRAEVADILRSFPELHADMPRRPQHTTRRPASSPEVGPRYVQLSSLRRTAH